MSTGCRRNDNAREVHARGTGCGCIPTVQSPVRRRGLVDHAGEGWRAAQRQYETRATTTPGTSRATSWRASARVLVMHALPKPDEMLALAVRVRACSMSHQPTPCGMKRATSIFSARAALFTR